MNSPTLTPAQRDRDIAALRTAIAVLERAPVVTPCAACERFDAATGYCARWKAEVPAEARAVGCPEWSETAPF